MHVRHGRPVFMDEGQRNHALQLMKRRILNEQVLRIFDHVRATWSSPAYGPIGPSERRSLLPLHHRSIRRQNQSLAGECSRIDIFDHDPLAAHIADFDPNRLHPG